jgi:SAM-dependent MidA family methyltransferase
MDDAPRPRPQLPGKPASVSAGPAPDDDAARRLQVRIAESIRAGGGWMSFERFMQMALVEPGLGYYARGAPVFGLSPADGSDFATAPEISPLFGQALARQVLQALEAGAPAVVTEFGGGSGALAEGTLAALHAAGRRDVRWQLLEVSADLRARQAARLAAHGERVTWLDALPDALDGVVIGNEVLDALPVALMHWDGRCWRERGVALDEGRPPSPGDAVAFRFEDRDTGREPPHPGPFAPGTTVEAQPQAQALAATVAERLRRGLALFVDYGFPADEFYHPQRTGGTLMCHRAHRSDADPLTDVGRKDITAHVDFTGVALAAQGAGAQVLGYTSQGRFLLNLGLAADLADADVRGRVAALRLVAEHEMGELFKVLAFGRGLDFGAAGPTGFVAGDRTHRL